jgi:hypothetical protein
MSSFYFRWSSVPWKILISNKAFWVQLQYKALSPLLLNGPFRPGVDNYIYAQKSLPLFPIRSQLNPVNFPPCFSEILRNIILPSTSRSSNWFVRFRFTVRNFVRISHLSNACNMSHQSYNLFWSLWTSSLHRLSQPPATFSLLGLNTLRTLVSDTLTSAYQNVRTW